jgi:retinol dehydrogenase 12
MAQFDKLAERFLAHTSEQGSRQLVWAAIGGKGRENELRGAYIAEADVQEPNDNVISEDGKRAQDRLWVGLIFIYICYCILIRS